MRLSTRNQLSGTVADIQLGAIMASVKVTLTGGETITAAITREAAEELGLSVGDATTVLVKSTEVMLAVD
jgi:molybdopterin-binding protein